MLCAYPPDRKFEAAQFAVLACLCSKEPFPRYLSLWHADNATVLWFFKELVPVLES